MAADKNESSSAARPKVAAGAKRPAPTKRPVPRKAPVAATAAAAKPSAPAAAKAPARAAPASPPPAKKPGADSAADKVGLREREAVRVFAVASDFHRRGRLDEAIRGYARALSLNPRLADAYNNIGVALRTQGKLEAAIACYQRSLVLRPNTSSTYSNLGNALRELGRLEAAAASMQQAIRLAPDGPEPLYNLGLVLRDMGQDEKALTCFETVLKMRPDHVECHWDRALLLLLRGDFPRGFEEYEWRWKLKRSPPRGFRQPVWDGRPFQGKTVLLHQEQGFGDMIQFARYIPIVKKLGGRVMVECQGEIARLVATVEGIDQVIVRGSPLPPFDMYAPMLSLPRILKTTKEAIPAAVPYVKPPELSTIPLPVGGQQQLRIGISWAGRPTHRNDRNRSCGIEHFVELMGMPGTVFFSLQKGDRAQDLRDKASEALVMDVGRRLEDFADTASVVQQLDLVITVDTALAHLAGALGKPAWVAIPFVGDWRWMREGETTPWYPSMRLFRQKTRGDWNSTFNEMRRALRLLVNSRMKGAGA